MMHRTQITLDPAEHRRARRRAADMGISMAEYVRRLVQQDLAGPAVVSDPSALFALGDSGGSDVAVAKDAYVAEAIDADRRGR
ncbi:MAG TPA: hypothetical protein VID25_01640 [Candidatus Limnocylindrales bacterium]|jgi:hypothetical protein